MTIAVDPKIIMLVTKLVVIFGMSVIEAIDETSKRTGIPASVIRKLIK